MHPYQAVKLVTDTMLYPTSPPCLPIWIASAKPCNPRHWKHWFEKHINVRGEGGRGWRNKKHCSGAQRSSWSSTASTFVFNSDIWQPCAVSIKCRMVCRGTWMWVISSARQKNEQRGEEEEKYRERERREREKEAGGEKGNRASRSVPSLSFNTAPTVHSSLPS